MSSLLGIEEKIILVNWDSYEGPEYYEPERAKNSLLSLVSLDNEIENTKTYNNVLFGIGNNHAGTYYPAAREAVKIICEIATKSECEISKNCALEILVDLYCSFEPELGSYSSISSEQLESLIFQEIESLENIFVKMLSLSNESDRNKSLAKELLESIDENRK